MNLWSWASGKWRALQVELHGQYSDAQLQRFEQYQATTSLWRVAAVCLLTPLSMFVVTVAMGLLRLEPIENGALHSPHVWTRQWLTMICMSICVLQQLRQHLPEFKIDLVDCLLISLCTSTCDVGSVIALSSVVGYPLPFTVILGSIPWYVVFIAIFAIRKRRIIRETPGLSSVQQTAFVLILPLIKLLNKNWICRTLPDTDDAKPEAIVFNVEVFHALFVSLCMGNTTSTRTVVVLMAVDLAEVWISFHDVHSILQVLQPVANKLKLPKDIRLDRYASIAMLATDLIGDTTTPVPPSQPDSQVSAWWKKHIPKKIMDFDFRYIHASAKVLHRGQVAPSENTQVLSHDRRPAEATNHFVPARGSSAAPGPRQELLSSVRACLSPVECALLVTQTEKLLFVTEFVVLVEYTEVIMPTVYNLLVWSFYNLPNREFYTFLQNICDPAALHGIMSNVQLYASLEMLSLVVMTVVLWRRIGLSVVHQLAFVLEDRAANIQSKLVLWVVFIMQISVVHYGSDYSLQFKWLARTSGAASDAVFTQCTNGTAAT